MKTTIDPLLDRAPQSELEDCWIYHDVQPEWVSQAKAFGLTVTAPCGYVFKPVTPPHLKAPAAPAGAVVTVRMVKCRLCVELSPRFARQQELWKVG